jgi:predicted ABC-type ATPase
VAGELQKQKENVLSTHHDFAFETNFSSDMVLEMIAQFKEAGYKKSTKFYWKVHATPFIN